MAQPEDSEPTDPTSSEIMTVEVHEQTDQQLAGDHAAAEQVFMYLQVTSHGLSCADIAAWLTHVCMSDLPGTIYAKQDQILFLITMIT